jgi:hypothetical protein
MKAEYTRLLLILLVFGGFFGLMLIILMGFVSISDPEVAKLVGGIFGFLTGMMSPIVTRYFRSGESP